MIDDVLKGVGLVVGLALDNIPPGDPRVKVARVKSLEDDGIDPGGVDAPR